MEITTKVVDKQTIYTLTNTVTQVVIEETTIERVQQTIANIEQELANVQARLDYQKNLLAQLLAIKL